MLYFHPWEFDPDQQRLPLSRLSSWRTYVGIGKSRPRLRNLLTGLRFARAIDVANRLKHGWNTLPGFSLPEQQISAPFKDRLPVRPGFKLEPQP